MRFLASFISLIAVASVLGSRAEAQVATGFVFPSVASTPGQFGAYFHTRVVISNLNDFPIDVPVALVTPNGSLGRVLSLGANSYLYWDDFLLEEFGYTGGAGLGFQSIGGYFFSATAEVYTDGPSGRYSTFVPGLLLHDRVAISGGLGKSYAIGVRRDGSNRLNYGCANFNSRSITVTVRIGFGGSEIADTISLPDFGWVQRSASAGSGIGYVRFSQDQSEQAGDLGVYCYGVTVNNGSNDGTVTAAIFYP